MINVGEILLNLWQGSGFNAIFSGFTTGGWQNLVMLIIACVLLYLGIVKKFEPLLLVLRPLLPPPLPLPLLPLPLPLPWPARLSPLPCPATS